MSILVEHDSHPDEYRDKITKLEQILLDHPDRVDLEVNHYFAHGTYTRELIIPAGAVLTGHIHRHSCINIMTKGRMRLMGEGDPQDVEAPFVAVTGAGVKKAAYALEDSIWINVFPWNGVDTVEQLEESLVFSSYEALDQEKEDRLCHS